MYVVSKTLKMKKKKKRDEPTTHSIPRRSPIQVLTALDVA